MKISSDAFVARRAVILVPGKLSDEPAEVLQFGSASLCNTVKYWSVNPLGLAMSVKIKCGSVVYFVGVPKCDAANFEPYEWKELGAFNPAKILDSFLWDCEAVIVGPGEELCVQSNMGRRNA
jgi:hypothetical protein